LPGGHHIICIRENGAAFYQGAYHNPALNGEVYEPLDKDYGFLGEYEGDRKGEFERTMRNSAINLFGHFNVIGRSLEISLGTREEQGKEPHARTAAIGNLGKTGDADVPEWDYAPKPCAEMTTLPHGGGNAEICEIYKSIVKGYPDINTKGFNTRRW